MTVLSIAYIWSIVENSFVHESGSQVAQMRRRGRKGRIAKNRGQAVAQTLPHNQNLEAPGEGEHRQSGGLNNGKWTHQR